MSLPKLEIITSDTGDWVRLIYDGQQVFNGHNFSHYHLEQLLKDIGIELQIKTKEVPEEELE